MSYNIANDGFNTESDKIVVKEGDDSVQYNAVTQKLYVVAPNGTKWLLIVDNDGILTTSLVI